MADDVTPPVDTGAGTVLPKSLLEEMQTSYMDYAMSVIISRALPEVRDGLKPVQRRILYAMNRAGGTAGARHRKSAAYVGDVMKLYHPHGDAPVNGATGIAVGMTTNIPPHNLREVASAVTYLVENPDATVEDLMRFVPGPDFPTGGIIMGRAGIRQAYATGHGKIIVRARHTFEEAVNGRERIIVDELPYAVNKANLVAKIAELSNDRKLDGVADLRDESDRQGMRIVIELKREARPYTVLNNLYKHTALQQTFGAIMLAIVDGRPQALGLTQMLRHLRDPA